MIDGIEEALDFIIQKYKNNVESLDDVRIVYCDEIKWNCSDCPFRHGETCENAIAEKLIERLIKVEEHPEEHQETNFDHYVIKDAINITKENDCEKWDFSFKKGAEKEFLNGDCNSVFEWLLKPYGEKRKFKLTQFEYDLLEYHSGSKFGFKDFWILEHMQDKGYFKDIPNDVPIRDILGNCEVVDE